MHASTHNVTIINVCTLVFVVCVTNRNANVSGSSVSRHSRYVFITNENS
jgi:hypothetical protein